MGLLSLLNKSSKCRPVWGSVAAVGGAICNEMKKRPQTENSLMWLNHFIGQIVSLIFPDGPNLYMSGAV